MASPLKFLQLGKSILLRTNRARSNSGAVSSLLLARGFNSLLRNDPTNAFIGFRENGCQNSLPCGFGGFRSFHGDGVENEMREGDWICPECNFHNFARNIRCPNCKAKRVDVSNAKLTPGDWICPQCQFMNFSRNTSCKRCQEPSPASEKWPRDWKCPACGYLNFVRNSSCRKCNNERPEEAERAEGA